LSAVGGRKVLDEFEHKCVAVERLRRQRREVAVLQVLGDETFVDAASRRQRSVLVARKTRLPADPVIDHGTAGPGVEGDQLTVAIDPGHVGDAADIEDRERPRQAAGHRRVVQRHQRRPLPAGGHVAAAEVGHHADCGQFGEQRGIADLRGVAALRPVPHGLAVAADGADFRGRDFRSGKDLGHGGRISRGERVAGERGALDFVLAARIEAKQFAPQRGVEGDAGVGNQPRLGAGEIRQHRIDPVEAGARHQADVELAIHSMAATWLFARRSSCATSGCARARNASMS